MKKIIAFLILIFTLYIVAIFKVPTIATTIWEKLNIIEFNKTVIKISENYNDFMNKHWDKFTVDNIKQTTSDIKDWVETWIKTTQDTLDNIRDNVEKASDSIKETQEKINETKESIENVIDTVSDVTDSLSNISGEEETGNSESKENTWNVE